MEEIRLEMNEQVRELIEERGIREEEVRQVIEHAEATGDKLYSQGTGRYLAKLRISEATFYIEYSIEEERYIVHTGYTHQSEIKGVA